MTLLLGDASIYSTSLDNTAAANLSVYRYAALATGTVDTIMFRTSATEACANTSTVLGIYADKAGPLPGTILGQGTAAGTPGLGVWITVTGLSIPVTSGTFYWLADLALGGQLNYRVAGFTAGVTERWTSIGGFTSLTSNPNTGTNTDLVNGIGFQATGSLTVATPRPVRVINQAVRRAANW